MIATLRECFVKWFGDNISFFQCSDGGVRISIPIVDEYNDDICIYMYKRNNTFRITDKGEAYRSLHKAGIPLSNNDSLDYILSSTISRYNSIFIDNEKALVSEGSMDVLPDAVMFLSQAVSALENIKRGKSVLRSRTPSFSHKLESFFDERGYQYINKPKLIGAKGFEHSFDYQVASRQKDNSILLSILPNQSIQAKFSLLYEWDDVRGYAIPQSAQIIAIERGIQRSIKGYAEDPEVFKINKEMYRSNIILAGSEEYENALVRLVG